MTIHEDRHDFTKPTKKLEVNITREKKCNGTSRFEKLEKIMSVKGKFYAVKPQVVTIYGIH